MTSVFRGVLLGIAIGCLIAYALIHFLGNAGVWAASFGIGGWMIGFLYGFQSGGGKSRRRRSYEPDRTQRALFEQIRQQEEQAEREGRR